MIWKHQKILIWSKEKNNEINFFKNIFEMQKQTGFNEFIIIIIIIILKIIIFFHNNNNNNNNNNNFLPLTTILALPLNFLITISELQAMWWSGVKIQSKDRNGKRIVKEFKFEEEGNVLKLSSGAKDNHYY